MLAGIITGVIIAIAVFYVERLILVKGKWYNTLVYFEMKLNTLLSILDDNQFQIRKGLNTKGILLLLPHELTIDENRVHQIGRIIVKNKLISLSLDLEKYNNSLRTAIAGFQQNIDNLKTPPLGLSDEEKQRFLDKIKKAFSEQISTIEPFGNKLADDIMDVLVDVRFFLKRDKSRLTAAILQKRHTEDELDEWRKEDKERLRTEIESGRKKDLEIREKFGVKTDLIGEEGQSME